MYGPSSYILKSWIYQSHAYMYEVNVETILAIDPASLALVTHSIYMYAKILEISSSLTEVLVASLDGEHRIWLSVAPRGQILGDQGDYVKIYGDWINSQTVRVHSTQICEAEVLMDPERIAAKAKRIKLTIRMAARDL